MTLGPAVLVSRRTSLDSFTQHRGPTTFQHGCTFTAECNIAIPDGTLRPTLVSAFLPAPSTSALLASKTSLHWPGIEPGPPAWQARILPLNHQCSHALRSSSAPTLERVSLCSVKRLRTVLPRDEKERVKGNLLKTQSAHLNPQTDGVNSKRTNRGLPFNVSHKGQAQPALSAKRSRP